VSELLKNNILPNRLKISRKKCGWTQEWVAEKLNISIGTLSGYERGYRNPNNDMLRKLAELYKTTTDYLLGLTDNPRSVDINKEPDFDSIWREKTLADAITRIVNMRAEFNLPKEWMYQMWDKAVEVYGSPEGKGGIAAHGPSYPGSGALDGDDEPR